MDRRFHNVRFEAHRERIQMVALQCFKFPPLLKVRERPKTHIRKLIVIRINSGDTATCLYNTPHEDSSLPRVLPGKLLTLDAQCRRDRGTSACFVSSSKLKNVYFSKRAYFTKFQKDDRVCAQLFCFDSGSGYCVAYRPAAEGSPCGDGQVWILLHTTYVRISLWWMWNFILSKKTGTEPEP